MNHKTGMLPLRSPFPHTARPWLAAVAAVVTAVVLAACNSDSDSSGGGGSPEASDAEIPQLTWSMPYPVSNLDPGKAFNTSSLLGIALGLETLEVFDKEGHLQPLLATKSEQVDPTTYVYTLRDGVTFWDGKKMTAEDVAYSLNRHRDPKLASQMATFFDNVASIEPTGDLEVTVKLKKPDATWKYVPALAGQVVEKKYAENAGKALGGADKMTMGTGAYRFTSFTPEPELEAERFDGYWGDAPSAKRVTIRTIEDDSTRLLAMRSGEIDGSFYLPATGIGEWKSLQNAVVHTTPSTESYMFFFDTRVAPFSDVHVRRTFAYALDRDAVAEKLLRGNAQAADLYMPKRVWTNLLSDEEVDQLYDGLPQYDFDMDAAAAELAKSSVPDGFDVTLNVPSGTDPLSKAALTLAQNLKSLGINLSVKEIPAAQWNARVYGHKGLTFETLGDASVMPDPNYFASFLDANESKPNGNNYASFKNQEATQLFNAQSSETDADARADKLERLVTIAAEELPYLGVYWQDSNVAVAKDLVYDELGPWFWVTNWAAAVKAAR